MGALNVGEVYGTLEMRDGFSKSFTAFHAAAATAVAGLGALAMKAIQVAGEWEQSTIAFTTLLGSASEAKKFLADLQDFAAKTPFELPDLLTASRRLLAMGFAAQEVRPMLTSIGDAAAGLGLSGAEGIGRLTKAFGDMRAKGKVSGEEMRQFAEAGVPAWQFLADKIGKSIPEAMELVTKGAINATVGTTAIMEGMNSKFGGMMVAQSKTLLGIFSTLKDEMSFMLRDFGTALMPLAKQLADAFIAIMPTLRDLVFIFADVVGAIAEVTFEAAALGAEFIGSMAPAAEGLSASIKELTNGTVDFKTAFENLNVVGDIIRITWDAVKGVWIDIELGLNEASQEAGKFGKAISDAISKIPGANAVTGKTIFAGGDERFKSEQAQLKVEAAALREAKLGLEEHARALIIDHKAQTDNATATAASTKKKLDDARATDAQTKAAAALAKKLAEIRAAFTGEAAQASMNELAMALKNVNLETGLSFEGKYNLADKLLKLRAAGATMPPMFDAFTEALKKTNAEIEEMGPHLDRLSGGIAKLPGGNMGGTIGQDFNMGKPAALGKTVNIDIGRYGAADGATYGKSFVEKASAFFGPMFSKLPGVIMGAIQGGGDVGKSIGASLGTDIGGELGKKAGPLAGKLMGDLLGKTAGKALGGLVGSAVPIVGTLIGSFVGGKLGGLVGKLFGSAEKETNKMRDEVFAAAGGFEKLNVAAAKAGISLKEALSAKTPEAFKAAMEKVQLSLTRQSFIDSAGGIDTLREKATAAGFSLDAMLKATTVEQYEAAIKKLGEEFETLRMANEGVASAMERWGLEVSDMGPKFQQQKLDEQAMSLLQDWKLLLAAGADMGKLFEVMGGDVNAFFQRAKETGMSIPLAMKPMFEEWIKNKKLVDENGKAYETLEETGVTFAETMTEAISRVADQIERMVNALLGIPNDIPINVHTTGSGTTVPGGSSGPNNKYEDPNAPEVSPLNGGGSLPLMSENMGGGFAPLAVKIGERELLTTLVELKRDNRYSFGSDF